MPALHARVRSAKRIRRLWPLGLALLALLLTALSRSAPVLTEQLYARRIYPLLAGFFGGITSLLPVSIFESCVLLLLLSVPVLAVRAYRSDKPVQWGRWLGFGAKAACIVLFLFVTTCGLNYNRQEFTVASGLTIRNSSVEELAALCAELTEQANALRAGLPEDEQGVMHLSGKYRQTAKDARDAFGRLSEEYAVLPKLPITPKPVLNSWLMSMLQITGQFTPYTFEANINVAAPQYSIPATMCHELAHTRGFMREDEANFIGYLACMKSDSSEVRYSGAMLALVHANNRLYSSSPELFRQVDGLLSDGVRRDFEDNNAYWKQFEGPVAEVSEAVNNTYLKVNHQQDGTRSYGRMVDLLLADYRARHGAEAVPTVV